MKHFYCFVQVILRLSVLQVIEFADSMVAEKCAINPQLAQNVTLLQQQ